LIVMDAATVTGPEYTVPTVPLGVEPSVVYRIVASGVAVDRATLCAGAYVPAEGLKIGAATVSPLPEPDPPPQAGSRMDRSRRERIPCRGFILFISRNTIGYLTPIQPHENSLP